MTGIDEKITAMYVTNPITLDPGDIFPLTENTDTTPLSGAAKISQLMFNRYKVNASTSSNNLIYSLTHEDGSAPSTDRPLYFKIGTALRIVTAALVGTINAGTSTFNAGAVELATKKIYYAAYAGFRAAGTAVFLGISRITFGRTYADFSATPTNEKYFAFTGSAPASSDEVVNIGMLDATNSGTASYNWSVSSDLPLSFPNYITPVMQWTPVYSALSSMTITGGTAVVADYRMIKDGLDFSGRFTGTLGTPMSSQVFFTLPFNLKRTDGVALAALLYNEAGTVGFAGAFYSAGTPHKAAMITYNFGTHTPGAGIWEPFGFYYI